MINTSMSQRLSARMKFKSLLVVTLLAGYASAQQEPLPSVPNLVPAQIGLANCSELPAPVPRSTWTLRQHTSWLLGLKLKPTAFASASPEPAVPALTLAESLPTNDSVPQLLMPTIESTGPIQLVQYAEGLPEVPQLVQSANAETSSSDTTADGFNAVAPAVHSQANDAPVVPAQQTAPRAKALGPVVSAPAQPLPLEKLDAESLLQVDVSGIDANKLLANQAKPELGSLDILGVKPSIGFSMRDNDSASVAASPSKAQSVSVHEGFTPRASSANQGMALQQPVSKESETNDRLTLSTPASTQFSFNDRNDAIKSSAPGGAVLERLSDKDVVREKLSDKEQTIASKASSTGSVETKMSDKGSILDSKPVEVSANSDRTSRSGKPLVLTPPDRLAGGAPPVLPLTGAKPIASTGLEDAFPAASKTVEAKDQKPVEAAKVATKAPTKEATAESLLDTPVPPPTSALLSAVVPTKVASEPQNSEVPKHIEAKPSDSPVATPSNASLVKKADEPKRAERMMFTDANPITLKRPVVKAAAVAIPNPEEATVIQSSHEMDESDRQLAHYAKTAGTMQQAVKQKFPNSRVKITSNEDGLVVEGRVANESEAGKILSFVRKTSLCPVADRILAKE